MICSTLGQLVILAAVWSFASSAKLCSEVEPKLELPCQCDKTGDGDISVNCDYVAFEEDFPLLPYKMSIKEYQQRYAGLQGLTSQLFTASQLPLKKLDFSHNEIRLLNGKVFEGLEPSLEVLLLQHNRFGDVYTQQLSLPEIARLRALKTLNLGNNEIQALDDSLLRNLTRLQVLQLEGNFLVSVPTTAMEGLNRLKALTLQENDIDYLPRDAFSTAPELVFLNVSHNQIATVEGGAFEGLPNLTALDLSYNRLISLPSEAFDGLFALETLDLSSNFFNEIPADALKDLKILKTLHMQNNRIQTLGGIVALGPANTLRTLDLTRNNIVNLESRTFKRLTNLVTLKLSVNSVGKKNSHAFEGLESLEILELDDHRFFSFPSTMLAMTPALKSLSLNYNRIRVLTAASLQVVNRLQSLYMAGNIIREITSGTFQNFTNLKVLNLNGNKITHLDKDSFSVAGRTLTELDMGNNLLTVAPQLDLPQLIRLSLSGNKLNSLPDDAFLFVPQLKHLDLSRNEFSILPKFLFDPLSRLGNLDLSGNKLNKIAGGQFNGTAINVLILKDNQIEEIESNAFENLFVLTSLDLSNNKIQNIKENAFYDTTFLHILNLKNNKLSSFRKNLFGFSRAQTGTHLRYVDLSNNDITFIQDDSFASHPQIIWLSLSNNRLTFFPSNALLDLTEITQLDLSKNQFDRVSKDDFSNIFSLRELDLSQNKIEEVSELSFQNSTQLQELNLSFNKIKHLYPDNFKGIARLKLDLSHNDLVSFPDMIFDRSKMKLLTLNLAHNHFQEVPVKVLRSQYYFFSELIMSYNNVSNIPNNADALVNVKYLDLSFNPLTSNDILELLNEPKLVRNLNLAGTKVKEVPLIEARFLISLNLSNNYIGEVTDKTFKLTHNLRSLDLSNNQISNIHSNVASSWPELPNLRYLDISGNPINDLQPNDFRGLKHLKVFKAAYLELLKKVDTAAFNGLSLRELYLYGIPMVGDIDVQSILDNMSGLEKIDIELSRRQVDEDLRGAFSPRLRKLFIRGQKVQEIKSSAFLDLNSPVLDLGIINTNVSKLDERMLFLVPMSSDISLHINNSHIESLSLKFLEDVIIPRKGKLELSGIESNPLYCDCNMQPLRNWLLLSDNSMLKNITCHSPKLLAGMKIINLSPSQLVCSERQREKNNLNDIITKDEIDRQNKNQLKFAPPKENQKKEVLNLSSMDKLVYGIVGGVLLSVLLTIVISCFCWKFVCKRKTDPFHTHGGNCTCVKPPMHGYPGPYSLPPGSRVGTLKSMPPTTPIPPPYGTLGAQSRASYYSGPPSYMGMYPQDEHDYR